MDIRTNIYLLVCKVIYLQLYKSDRCEMQDQEGAGIYIPIIIIIMIIMIHIIRHV